ncbi:winged helix-turn-helix domain-containing protein [Kitasatospora camelliae]|uniref:Winged helix-turn-helix domain-containing protein n=1 Tax=Kitasatospora camelliae TaxID=3156397 RepID=A0AAU8K2M2_9ACTN
MSSSTATLPVPSATPHLRAVRSVQPGAERWRTPAVPQPAARPAPGPLPVADPAEAPVPYTAHALLNGLPEGATVVAALPQSALPPQLLARFGAQPAARAGAEGEANPLVGYLVLVPADQAGPLPDQPRPANSPARPRPAVVPADRGITVDPDRRNAYVDGRLLDLTYLEFELLAHLAGHPHRVHTRDHLVTSVWGYGHVGDGRTVDVHVARLRRKLGSPYRDAIVTVRRVGYKYAPIA